MDLHANDNKGTIAWEAKLIANKYGLSQKDVAKIIDAALRKLKKVKARAASG